MILQFLLLKECRFERVMDIKSYIIYYIISTAFIYHTSSYLPIIMPCMYSSGEDSNNITYDDPVNKCVRISPSLYAKVQDDNEKSRRIFLDTHLLKIGNIPHNQQLPTLEHT